MMPAPARVPEVSARLGENLTERRGPTYFFKPLNERVPVCQKPFTLVHEGISRTGASLPTERASPSSVPSIGYS